MKWMRERKWYLKTMAVGFIGSFFLLFLFYRQAALCFLGAVLGSVCYVRYRIKVQKEQEKWQLMVEFKEAMDSMVSALAAGYSMENAITEAYRDMKLLHSEDTRMICDGKKKRREFGKSDEADGTEYQREDGDTERNSNDDCRKKDGS